VRPSVTTATDLAPPALALIQTHCFPASHSTPLLPADVVLWQGAVPLAPGLHRAAAHGGQAGRPEGADPRPQAGAGIPHDTGKVWYASSALHHLPLEISRMAVRCWTSPRGRQRCKQRKGESAGMLLVQMPVFCRGLSARCTPYCSIIHSPDVLLEWHPGVHEMEASMEHSECRGMCYRAYVWYALC
jgi:hypothetical protein